MNPTLSTLSSFYPKKSLPKSVLFSPFQHETCIKHINIFLGPLQETNNFFLGLMLRVAYLALDDQTQVDSKPAGQPERANLNQCQLIAANCPKLVLCACTANGGDKVSL